MARKAKPIASQEQNRRVHRSKAELEERRKRELAFTTDDNEIMAPAYLTTNKQRERFDSIVSLMRSVPGFPCTNLDSDAIARYVLEEEEYLASVKALRHARNSNDVAARDMEKLQRMKNSAFKCVDTSAKAIGLTIDARLRFDVKQEEEKPKNKFESLRNVR